MALVPIGGCAWVDTDDGVVLIDSLVDRKPVAEVPDRIQGKIKYIIYTHGHLDHVGGAHYFMADKPEVIASQYLPDRLDKYKELSRHFIRITAQQFNIPANHDFFLAQISRLVYPTQTFIGEKTIKLGEKTFEMHTARAETDDAC
jgi:glyoxylase-like metal-dependent hydrolase (beta-lactamase superfamily II)